MSFIILELILKQQSTLLVDLNKVICFQIRVLQNTRVQILNW